MTMYKNLTIMINDNMITNFWLCVIIIEPSHFFDVFFIRSKMIKMRSGPYCIDRYLNDT